MGTRRYVAAVLLLLSWSNAFVALAQSTRRAPERSGRAAPASYTNPVLDADFPDPTVMRAADGLYYAYGTQTEREGRTINIQVARSKDLVTWEHLGDALPVKPKWASETQNFWAPDVSLRGDTYYLYYSAEPNSKDGLCLAVATSKSPAGPFADSGRPMKCGEGFVNIDPMAFDDPKTGKRLLYWGSGFKAIKAQELAPDRLGFLPGSEPIDLVSPSQSAPYEKLVEGAWVVERSGTYYLYYSGDNCCGPKASYAVMVARSKSATGPFEKLGAATGAASSVILAGDASWVAPGHNSVVRDADGQEWIFYHAIDPKNRLARPGAKEEDTRRVMLVDRIVYRDGWPRVERAVPSRAPQRRPRAR
jgi:arabinan endo-1,5-alpha-L-arabinosidase